MAEDTDTTAVTVNLSTSPMDAFLQPSVTLLVGLEEDGDTFRAYLGARWKGVHLVLPISEIGPWRTAWNAGGHVWVWPIPPADFLHRDGE